MEYLFIVGYVSQMKPYFVSRFKLILRPIADVCITKEQQHYVDFDSFFTHTICHECCHGIGPHSITLPSGNKSTVRLVSWLIRQIRYHLLCRFSLFQWVFSSYFLINTLELCMHVLVSFKEHQQCFVLRTHQYHSVLIN